MKTEKLFSLLWAWGLAFCLSFGAVSCVVTGFRMSISLLTVGLWCALSAAFCCVCYSLPLGLLPVSSLALISGILWQRGLLKTSFEALLYRISRQYNRGYGWGILKLNYLTADDMELQLWLILCVMGVIIAMLTTWAVCRKKTAVPAVLLSLLLLASCMVVTDTVPGTMHMYLLLFGILMLMMTNTVRRQEEKRANRLSVLLTVPVLLVLLALFTMVPKNEYAGKEAPRDLVDRFMESELASKITGITPEGSTSGSSVDSNIVNLQTVGVRLDSNAEIMRVLTDFDGKIYLRGRALDCYDGTTWQDSGSSTAELYWPDSQKLSDGGEVRITTRYAHRMLYLPYYVSSKDLTEMTKGLENTKKLNDYSFSCDVLSKGNDYFAICTQIAYEDTWDVEFAPYLHLSDSVWSWAKPLATEITEGHVSTYDRVQAIADYVRSSATYSTNTYRMPSSQKDFVRWFLEDSDTGYCVHFASATTVLLQAAGIPARYVTGYVADTKAAHLQLIRAKDAHAWTEYWLPGYGWMVLDATPSADSPSYDPDPIPETQPTQPSESQPQQSEEKPTANPKGGISATGVLVLMAVILALAVATVILQRVLRLHTRRKLLQAGDLKQQVLSCWQEVTCLARLLDETPDADLFEIAQKAKFSTHPVTQGELDQFHAYFANAHSRLKKHSLPRQILYRLILVVY